MSSAAARLLGLPLVLLLSLGGQDDANVPLEGVVTLVAHDDLLSSFDFRRGRAGAFVEDGEVRLEDAQIAYDVFVTGQLSIGFVHEERAELLDLGEAYVAPEARARDRALEYPIALFHTLFLDGADFLYVDAGGHVRPWEPADRILRGPPPAGMHHVEPRVGHTYLLRVRRDDAGSADELFKFQVIAFQPGHSVTLRWAAVPVR